MHKIKYPLIYFISVWLFFGCGSEKKQEPVGQSFQTEKRYIKAKILFEGTAWHKEERNIFMVISTQEGFELQWKALGFSNPHSVDFNKHLVFLIYKHYYGTPSDLKLKEIFEDNRVVKEIIIEDRRDVFVHFMFNVHSEEIVGNPRALIMLIPKTDMRIEFVEHGYFDWDKTSWRRFSPESD